MPVTINVDFTLGVQDPTEAYALLSEKLDLVRRVEPAAAARIEAGMP